MRDRAAAQRKLEAALDSLREKPSEARSRAVKNAEERLDAVRKKLDDSRRVALCDKLAAGWFARSQSRAGWKTLGTSSRTSTAHHRRALRARAGAG